MEGRQYTEKGGQGEWTPHIIRAQRVARPTSSRRSLLVAPRTPRHPRPLLVIPANAGIHKPLAATACKARPEVQRRCIKPTP